MKEKKKYCNFKKMDYILMKLIKLLIKAHKKNKKNNQKNKLIRFNKRLHAQNKLCNKK